MGLPEATIMAFAPPTLPGTGNASGFNLRILAQAGQSAAETGAGNAAGAKDGEPASTQLSRCLPRVATCRS